MRERHLRVLTPDSASAAPTPPPAGSGSNPAPEWAPEYLRRVEQLGQPHAPEHECFLCASLRQALGVNPVEPDYADLFGVRWMP